MVHGDEPDAQPTDCTGDHRHHCHYDHRVKWRSRHDLSGNMDASGGSEARPEAIAFIFAVKT
jgi:hypothetical protein